MRRFPLSALLALGVGLCSSVSLAAPSTTLVISEFRVRGSVGGNDEFVEIYNLSNAPINAGGYMLWGSSSGGVTQLRATIPANTTIPSKGFYLFYNSTASTGYSGVTPGNTGYSLGISDDGGLALLAPGNVVVDAVGLSAGSAYKEGTTLTHWTSNQDSSFRRKSANCTPDVDTDNNANDFTKITPSTPQNLGSCCVDAHCASPPAGQCYPATGSCNATAGTCSYPIQTGATCNDADACTDSDVCLAGGACQGTNKACDTPPVPTCANATTQRTFASTGTCAGGACSYSSTDTACVTTCNAMTGLCADPCAGVTCNTPPNTQCYAAAGTCNMSSGSCDYTKSGVGTSCTDSDPCTVSDACDASGQCTGVPKTCTPPVAECIGQSSRTYSGGACTPGTGACTFSQSDVSCQFGCDGTSGTCKPNPCVGVSCVTPPGNCYQTDGLCNTSNGQCVYSPKVSNTPCDDGAACTTSDVCDGAGTCGGAAKVCTPPAPTCASATVSRSFSGGVCVLATGACTFQQADTPCASGCNAGTGLCNNDPCAGVVCDKPTSSCQQATGTCSGGVCTYPLKPDNAQCDDGDPCTGPDRCNALGACSGATQICNTPPAATCSTPTTSLVYAPVGTCGAGTCTYASSPTPCAFGCDAGTGLCVGDPCTDVQCTTPPSGCHVSLGTCNSGTCSYSLKQPGSSCSDGDACTTSDACDVVGACKGVPKSCNAPPAAVCVDAKTSRTAEAVGTCKAADGSCDYKTTDTVCATACDAGTGLCSGDPCATVKCDQPPSACHAATGTCAGGQCTYTPLQAGAACNDGNPCTTGDACTAGVCAGTAKVCNTPPPAECTGAKTSQTYAAVGTCSPVDGVCGYDVTTATCATSCDLKTGLCVNDPCTGMVCNKPTSPCQVATGECKAGACTYPSKPLGAACDDGNACTNQDTCDAAGMCKGMQIASCGAGGAGGGAGASGAGGAAGGTGGGGSTAAGNAGNGGAAGNATGGASAGGFGGTTSSGGSGNNPATAGKAGSVGAGSAGAPAGIDETDVATDSPGCGCATPGESLSGREWAFGLGALGLAWSISRRRRRA